MAKNGINTLALSHTQRMEKQTQEQLNLTREKDKTEEVCMRITAKEAEEYRAYKRRKKISEIMSATRIGESVATGGEDLVELLERALRLRQAALQVQPSILLTHRDLFSRYPMALDCVIGGNGETFPRVKAYEAKRALRMGVKELTLVVTPSWVVNGRYGDLRKEIKRVKRAARHAVLKIRVDRSYPLPTLAKLARIGSDLGAAYFSVPYFTACECLRAELSQGCRLEVSGVDTLELYQKMIGAGVGRIQTSRAWEIYTEWLREVETVALESVKEEARLPVETSGKERENHALTVTDETVRTAETTERLATTECALVRATSLPQEINGLPRLAEPKSESV